ncbi:hypothetical protein HZA97_07370 [Candidatus Woesearchaeota archaeon]|nr:hypothetical protein [Candidatus Woesearchaeota archaeon]
MKLAHFIEISVFAKPEENIEEIKRGIINLIPFNLEEEKLNLVEQNATSFNERTIKIFTVNLTKETHTNRFLKSVFRALSEHSKQLLKTQLDSRMDDEMRFFLRFDKQKWTKEKELFLTDSGDCYHVKATIFAFPKTKENAKEAVKKILDGNI